MRGFWQCRKNPVRVNAVGHVVARKSAPGDGPILSWLCPQTPDDKRLGLSSCAVQWSQAIYYNY